MVSNFDQGSLTRDMIQELPEHEIRKLMHSYKEQINEKSVGYIMLQNLEVDYCYLQRELQLRENLGLARRRQISN